jgi:hypothetical protein
MTTKGLAMITPPLASDQFSITADGADFPVKESSGVANPGNWRSLRPGTRNRRRQF